MGEQIMQIAELLRDARPGKSTLGVHAPGTVPLYTVDTDQTVRREFRKGIPRVFVGLRQVDDLARPRS